MWRSEQCLGALYRSSSFLSTALQRDIDMFHQQFHTFKVKHSYEFVSCVDAPIIETELYDQLPSDHLITTVLKRSMPKLLSKALDTPTLESCRMRVEGSIRENLVDMSTILGSIEGHIDPNARNGVRQYWLDDIKPRLDPNSLIVVTSLLLICNNEHIIKTKKAFLDMIQTLDASTLDDKFLQSIVKMTNMVS
tara:strand:+ start:220 stop:798 length:579 start_codon:yes stop_codon:yes gene_type:complete